MKKKLVLISVFPGRHKSMHLYVNGTQLSVGWLKRQVYARRENNTKCEKRETCVSNQIAPFAPPPPPTLHSSKSDGIDPVIKERAVCCSRSTFSIKWVSLFLVLSYKSSTKITQGTGDWKLMKNPSASLCCLMSYVKAVERQVEAQLPVSFT